MTVRGVVLNENRQLIVGEVPEPAPAPDEAIVRVQAVSLNRGELKRARSGAPGTRPGWDFAGVIEVPAPDGSGPAAGDVVAGLSMTGAAWSDRIGAKTKNIAVVPAGVTVEQAACLPIAGLTALHALRQSGALLGKRVLVTGATGGVGHFACALARLSGAHVVAAVRRKSQREAVLGFGAHEVVASDDASNSTPEKGSFDLVLESIGGRSIEGSLRALKQGGTCVAYGATGDDEGVFEVEPFFKAGGLKLYGLNLFYELNTVESASIGLGRILAMTAAKQLMPHIQKVGQLQQIAELGRDVLERKIEGKVVVRLGTSP